MDFIDFNKGNVVSARSNSSPSSIILIIMVLSISCGIGVMIVTAAFSGMGTSSVSNVDTFSVSDPSQDQVCTLTSTPDGSTLVVTQYNGFEWVTVSGGYVSVDGDVVTVDADGLQG